MWINSIANVGSIDPNLDYATAFVPRFKDGEHTVPNGGGSLFVAASATKEQKDAAWKVIKYFVSPEQQAYWSRITGYMPASFVAVNTPEMQQFYAEKPMYKTAIDQLQYAKGVPSSEIFLDIIDVFESAVQEVVISQSDPAEVLEAAIKLIHY